MGCFIRDIWLFIGVNLGFKGGFPMGWFDRIKLFVLMVHRSNVGVMGEVLLMFW